MAKRSWLDFHGGQLFVGDVFAALCELYPRAFVEAALAFYSQP